MGFFDYWLKETTARMAISLGMAGLIGSLYDNPNSYAMQPEDNLQQLNESMLASVFIMWSLGLFISIVTFGLEMLLHCCGKYFVYLTISQCLRKKMGT